MKLSQIVAFKNLLDDMTPLETMVVAHDKLAPILHTVKANGVQFENLTERLDRIYHKILSDLDEFDQTIESIESELSQLIIQSEQPYYNDSQQLYGQMTAYESTEYILNRTMSIDDSIKDYITARIQQHGHWEHAGMIIRPGHEDWINYLVNCDPLYLVDQHLDLLDPSVLRFNDQYQRRLRLYAIQESFGQEILPRLPDNQFGFCLVYNFFNFKPIGIIKQYLTELYNKLKPGGTIAFTFNDCDRRGAVELVERNFICYTPGRAVMSHIESLGFNVRQKFKMSAACTWVEIQKPGILTTLRGGQTLAKLVYKNNDSMHTEEQQREIRQHAASLGIGIPAVVNQIPIAQLVKLIKQRTEE